MPRKRLILETVHPYHIRNRSNNREFWYVPTDFLWLVCLEKLAYLQNEMNCRVICFVLMSNHYHLIIQTPDANIHEAMKYFHREVARECNRYARRVNHFFGGRYQWSLINDEGYFWNAIKYVFQNPLRAGMVSSVENYRFSSLNDRSAVVDWKISEWKRKETKVSLDLAWLNERFTPEQSLAITRGLKKSEFVLPRERNGHRLKIDAPASGKGTITF